MKISNGVDIIKISRLEKSIENPRFLSRVYGEKELQLYHNSGKMLSFLAGNFAAKEAFSKALELELEDFGSPMFRFLGIILGSLILNLAERH